jgi:hypothetical protein
MGQAGLKLVPSTAISCVDQYMSEPLGQRSLTQCCFGEGRCHWQQMRSVAGEVRAAAAFKLSFHADFVLSFSLLPVATCRWSRRSNDHQI